MKRAFETVECEAVRNSIFWELRYEKHDNRMKGCDVEQKKTWQMCKFLVKLFVGYFVWEKYACNPS